MLVLVAHNNNSKAELTTIKGDICDIEEIRDACRDATTVIHSAAHIDVSSLPDEKKLHLVNVKGKTLDKLFTTALMITVIDSPEPSSYFKLA